MNPAAWDRAKKVLAEAAALPAADRERFVIEQCADPELRREVLELLASPAPLTGIVAGYALQPGARVGPYTIEALLGSGGMGEVYRARDTTLKRSVAIKVLPGPLAGDPDRRSRFRREAQILAALNHPNIAHVHGFEESGAVAALVMELVDGPTLADTIARHALTLTAALAIAGQIVDALDAAHGQGIVHRDLKPANIKVREDGTVKVLDFGLAKAFAPTPSGLEAVSVATVSVRSTEAGIVLGTAPYMAPEQALGTIVDKRADIWSFGCVLFEMLSRKRAFAGKDISDTLSQVIGTDPDWTALPSKTPAPIVRLLRQCLQKDRGRRLADIADARLAIEEARSPSTEFGDGSGRKRVPPSAAWWRALPWMLTAASVGALGFLLVAGPPSRPPRVTAPLRLTADPGPGAILAVGSGAPLALSPDGTELVFAGQKPNDGVTRLFVQHLARQQAAVLLPETEGAQSPFFSPDGQWLAFFASQKLKKIPISGGAAITVCDAPNGRGGDWGSDWTIFFSPNTKTGLSHVSAEAGSTPVVTTTLDAGEKTQRFPQILPGGKALLFSSLSTQGDDFDFDKGNLVVQPLPTGARRVVERGAYFGRYVPSGHLLFLRNGTLFAETFDLARLEVTGAPIRVIENVQTNTTLGGVAVAISNAGMLAYTPNDSDRALVRPIEWIDRSGRVSSFQSATSAWGNLALAADGRRIAYDTTDGKLYDIWVGDSARGAPVRLTTSNSHSLSPVWTPDGRRIAFASQRGDGDVAATFNLYWQRADGSAKAERLTTSPNRQVPGSWHPNGKLLAFDELTPSHYNVMLLAMEGDEASGWSQGKVTTLLSADFDQRGPAFSPHDGRWLAYESKQAGEFNVYVRGFPGLGDQVQISTGGGLLPTWSRTRHELLYSTFDGQIMVVNYSVAGGLFKAEPSRPWPGARYNVRGLLTSRSRDFDLDPAGDRLALSAAGPPGVPIRRYPVEIFLNFFDELRRIAPAQPH